MKKIKKKNKPVAMKKELSKIFIFCHRDCAILVFGIIFVGLFN